MIPLRCIYSSARSKPPLLCSLMKTLTLCDFMLIIHYTFKHLLKSNLDKIVHIFLRVNKKITLIPQSHRHNAAHSHLKKPYKPSLGYLCQAITTHCPGSLQQPLHLIPLLQGTGSQSENICNQIYKIKKKKNLKKTALININ